MSDFSKLSVRPITMNHSSVEKVDSQLIKLQTEVDWTTLPYEIWLKIFEYVPQAEIYCDVSRVCKVWNELCRDISLWRYIDFHKLREDLDNRQCSHLPEQHFENILEVFRNTILSVKLSRYNIDLCMDNEKFISVVMCSNLQSLDIGFWDHINLPTIFCNCPNLENLSLEGCSRLQDSDFDLIKLLQNLKRLAVTHCVSLTSSFLSRLYKLPNLRALNCDGVISIKGSSLVNFFQHQPLLEELILDGEELRDDIVEFATSLLPNLRVFELSFSESISSYSILAFEGKYSLESFKLRKACDLNCAAFRKVFKPSTTFNLKYFTITECSSIDDIALNYLSQSCPHLKSFTVDWCWSINDKGISDIVNNCKKMAHMSLLGLQIKGDGWLDKLEKRLPYLEFLDVTSCSPMPDDELFDLVQRKPIMEVYTYNHERVIAGSSEYTETNNNGIFDEQIEIWKCPGEEGVEVIF